MITHHYQKILISDNLPATKDVWVIGDNFLKSVYHTLMALKNQSIHRNKPHLYLFDQYNVSAFWISGESSGIRCITRRILNSMINALNKSVHLPRLILFTAELDLLKYLAFYGYGASKIIAKSVSYMVEEATRTIEARKQDMKEKRLGSITYSEPKLIWMKIWDRPTTEKVLTLREKYNAILEETLTSYKHYYILDCDRAILGSHFDRNNNFNNEGKTALWKFVDQQLKKFDRQEISLKPNKVVSAIKNEAKSRHDKFLLPKPPAK